MENKTERTIKELPLYSELSEIFASSIKLINNDIQSTTHLMMSDNLTTTIRCNYELCSDQLEVFTNTFNTLLSASQKSNSLDINAFILEDKALFKRIETVFLRKDWSISSSIEKFNIATHDTSGAKCTDDNTFYLLKCYDHFYYIYNTKLNECLLVVKDEKKALTMINILLLTPYLSFGDMYAIHGGLVSNGNNNILLSNSSLGGKTTFALLFLENGWKIITEETTYITNHGNIFNYNVRNYFNIRVGTYLEFKDFFAKVGITNNFFLNMAQMDKSEWFEFGKKEQMLIYFDTLSKHKSHLPNNTLTHALILSLDKNKVGMTIESIISEGLVDRFLEISNSPTVMLFKDILQITNVWKEERKHDLRQRFRAIRNYTVVSGLNYRNYFDYLLQNINLIDE